MSVETGESKPNMLSDNSKALLNKIDNRDRRREIQRFVDACRIHTKVDQVEHMKWVGEAMELAAKTNLSNEDKKRLVVSIYSDLSQDERNKYDTAFDIGGAIEFVWSTSKNQYGVILRRKGFLSCLPCFSDASVVYNNGDVEVGLNVGVSELGKEQKTL